jgi:hypothetical protein
VLIEIAIEIEMEPSGDRSRPLRRGAVKRRNGGDSAAKHLPSRSQAGAGPGAAGEPTSRSAPHSRHQCTPLCGRVDLEVNTPVNARQHRERSITTTITTTTTTTTKPH